MDIKKFFLIGYLTLSLTGCGYRFGPEEQCRAYNSISVPFVEGDREGAFTSALIHRLMSTGYWVYSHRGADLVLQAALLPPEENSIGFAFAPADQGDNDFSDIIVANEARLSLAVQVSVIQSLTGETVLGPFKIGHYLDYDFESDLANRDFHSFSLGQLEMYPLARDAAIASLYDLLAEKVVDYVIHGW